MRTRSRSRVGARSDAFLPPDAADVEMKFIFLRGSRTAC